MQLRITTATHGGASSSRRAQPEGELATHIVHTPRKRSLPLPHPEPEPTETPRGTADNPCGATRACPGAPPVSSSLGAGAGQPAVAHVAPCMLFLEEGEDPQPAATPPLPPVAPVPVLAEPLGMVGEEVEEEDCFMLPRRPTRRRLFGPAAAAVPPPQQEQEQQVEQELAQQQEQQAVAAFLDQMEEQVRSAVG